MQSSPDVGSPAAERFAAAPDPGQAGTLDDLVEQLRLLKVWAGDPSYERITERINLEWSAAGRPPADLAKKNTVADCFRPGRRRINNDLMIAVVRALHPDVAYVTQWGQAMRVVGGQAQASSQVRVQDALPQDLAAFTGRTSELNRLRHMLQRRGQDGGAVVIEGMAGVGKTQLAVHVGHGLVREGVADRVLVTNLRGFHPDATQPQADPAAVLDGFLRLLGMPGHQIPHELTARVAAYRARLAGTRTLVVLDNAADAEQVAALLPATPGCPVLVTSRRSLTGLDGASHLTLDVFTPQEALEFLARALSEGRVGSDPSAAARIAQRCGHLPLVLGLVAAHILDTPGWSLADHADRLDERHRERRLDGDVQLAIDVSYQHLSPEHRRLLRRLALHPGQDFDVYAAAALAGADLPTAQAQLDRLCRDHLLQQSAWARFAFHDLVHAFVMTRVSDEDPPLERRAALTRLFDYYVGTAAAAMDAMYPAETHRRPSVKPPSTPAPELADADAAHGWLESERTMLVAAAAHTANNGWPAHTVALSGTLWRYLHGGYFYEAIAVHSHARDAAVDLRDKQGEAQAWRCLGFVQLNQFQLDPAAECLETALELFEEIGDSSGQAFTLDNLGVLERCRLHFERAGEYHRQALALHREAGRRDGEARSLIGLGVIEDQLGRLEAAAEYHGCALAVFEEIGHRFGTADALGNLSSIELRLGRYDSAERHMQRAMLLFLQDGNRNGEAWILTNLGRLHLQFGRIQTAVEHQNRALTVFREAGEPDGQSWALNGLGEAAHAVGSHTTAVEHHLAALEIAHEIGNRSQQARAHAGLGEAYRELGEQVPAREHQERADALSAEIGGVKLF